MKLLLIGEVYSDNLGDQIIHIITEKLIKEMYPNAEIKLLDIMGRRSNHQGDTKGEISAFRSVWGGVLERVYKVLCKNQYANLVVKKRSANRLKKTYQNSISSDIDLAIFIGGAVIQDTFVAYLDVISFLLAEKRIPVIFSGIGTGIQSKITKKIFKKIFCYSNIIGVSCRCAKERLTFNFHKNLQVNSTFDVAVVCSDVYIKTKNTSSCFGLGVMNSSRYSNSQIKSFWLDVIEDLKNRNIEWKIFTTGSRNDNVLAIEIIKMVGGEDGDVIIPRTVEQLVSTITSFCRVLSFRLHSHIICYSYGIPSVGIKWDNKIQDFFEKTKKSSDCFDICDDPGDIIDRLLLVQCHEEGISRAKNITYKNFNNIMSNIR